MKRWITAIACALMLCAAITHARDTRERLRPTIAGPRVNPDNGNSRGLAAGLAAPDTTLLGSWDFDNGALPDTEGWISVDRTAQTGTYFHVDDFAGLGGGDFGRLNPLEGNQSLWCGARPAADPVLCSYAALPGYGNNWNQGFCTATCVTPLGDIVVDYRIAWDSESGYDATWLDYAPDCGEQWRSFDGGYGMFDGVGSGFFSSVLHDSVYSTYGDSLRLRFRFESDDIWSDQDGMYDSDGGVILDSLTVSDASGIVFPTELFETEAVGDTATASGNWTACVEPGYGDFAALFQGLTLVQEDLCQSNLTYVWAFISGSTANYACGGYPGQAAIPYENSRGQYMNNDIWSPYIAVAGAGSTFELEFDVYRDLALDDVVFYDWSVRSIVGGCPGPWRGTGFPYFGSGKDWHRDVFDMSPYIEPGASTIQVAITAVDLCAPFGQCFFFRCHSHSPLIDNVRVRRIDTNGPTWSVEATHLFQDNFAADGTTTGTVRADMARDLLPQPVSTSLPGDSSVVTCADVEHGLATDPYTGSGPAVYAYLGVWPQGQPGKGGAALSGDGSRWPVVDSLFYAGDTWYCIRMDSARVGGGPAEPDQYCVDLNDNLFTPGDTICFVFGARNTISEFSYYSEFTGTTDDLATALSNPMEFTCLPASGLQGGDILYVDAADGTGEQAAFEPAFDYVGVAPYVDRFDVRGAGQGAGNGLASRVSDPVVQIGAAYDWIIWSTGEVDNRVVGDGTGQPLKSDDFGLLHAFMSSEIDFAGVWLIGDNVAAVWDGLAGASAIAFRSDFLNHSVVDDDHLNRGYAVSPYVIGEPGGCFEREGKADSLIAYGGCPTISAFDVLQAEGTATREAYYSNATGNEAAIVRQQTFNGQAATVVGLLSGFSFASIRDVPGNVNTRGVHLERVLECLGRFPIANAAPSTPWSNALAQNYPNPFNPSTTVEFTVRERGPVSLRVYNVAGQLVKTLVSDERAPGTVHSVRWDGRNQAGQRVASGVYFYRLVAGDYVKTRKMVVLK